MKKSVSLLLCCSFCALLFSGCGDTAAPAPAKKRQAAAAPAGKRPAKRNAATAYPAAVVKSYKHANSQACLNNLKQLGVSLNIFVMDNNRFPAPDGVAGLKQLTEQQNFPTSLLCCPQQRPASLTEDAVAFLYLGGTVGRAGGSKLPVAIEKPGRHGNNSAVLFSDGSVSNVTVPGKYTSVTQVIELCVPAGERARFNAAVKQIEK
ncbi:MAG: hypothetical protein IKC89_01450 [Lentisphaeria bacterium]|nr:hypothetical protein [Lentisphaeria bacterium]